MVSALSTSGLSAANIMTLFGRTTSSPDMSAKDSLSAPASANSSASITGAGAISNAAKAIQAIVTTIQVEKGQTATQGKISSTFSSASVSATYQKTVQLGSASNSITVDMTALASSATATAVDTSTAAGAMLSKVRQQETELEAAQGGALFDHGDIAAGVDVSTSLNWTSTSVNFDTASVANQGVQLYEQDNALSGVMNITEAAQRFQAPSAGDSSAATASTDASSGNDSSSSANTDSNGPALYLEISSWNPFQTDDLIAMEKKAVSDFMQGALTGENGTAPTAGSGFSSTYTHSAWDERDTGLSVSGTVISNYDPATVTARAQANGTNYSATEQSAAMGGAIVGGSLWNGTGQGGVSLRIVIPLKDLAANAA